MTEPGDPLQVQVTALFERFRLPVCRYLSVVLGRTGEAEELTQETFIRLYDYLRAGHAADEARFWLFRVAHNLAANALRRRRFATPMDRDLWTDLCQQMAALPDPERRLLNREQRRRLVEALAELSPQERRCLALRAEGFRYRELAELLGISYAAVVDSLRRAIAKLAGALHD
ncbi:MAG: sigma-70 family RNA polymerase sigma factor [Acidobacteria bacterium]|nr:sigma-70 family RNA polymerase sigma factor [Acidobacteriota bacterium]